MNNSYKLADDWRIEAANRSMFEDAIDAIVWFDEKGEIFHFNQQFLDMFGYTADQIAGRYFFAALGLTESDDDLAQILNGNDITKEMTVVSPNKQTLLVVAKLGPLKNKSKIFGGYAVLDDITAYKQTEEMLRERELRLSQLVSKAGLGIVIINQNHQVIEANQRFAEMLGYTPQELSELHTWDWEALVSEDEVRRQFSDISKIDTIFETIHRRKDGTFFDAEVSATGTSISGLKGSYSAVICICRDISSRKAAEEEIRYLSFHDSLTGLYNRRFLEEELYRLDVIRNLPISVIVGDVNGLKLINDAFGHLKGDVLLQTAADVMKNACRSDDIIARWGGDEFVILLPKTTYDDALDIMKRIRDKAQETEMELIKLSISLGVATKTKSEDDISKILVAAESDMYKKKLRESQNVIGQAIRIILGTLLDKNQREAQHSRNVAEFSQQIAIALGLSDLQANEMAAVGLLHDIGKIGIAEDILEKPGKLNSFEWHEITRHPEVGYRILSASNDTAEIARFVLAHHEHFDGSGYPAGVKGGEIPLQARILSVADAFDAMTSDRPFRAAMTEAEAIQELKKHAGSQFDPEIVDVFIGKVLSVKQHIA